MNNELKMTEEHKSSVSFIHAIVLPFLISTFLFMIVLISVSQWRVLNRFQQIG